MSSSTCCSQFLREQPGGRFQSAAGGVPVWASIDSYSAYKAGVFSGKRQMWPNNEWRLSAIRDGMSGSFILSLTTALDRIPFHTIWYQGYDAVPACEKIGSCHCLLCTLSTFQSHITLQERWVSIHYKMSHLLRTLQCQPLVSDNISHKMPICPCQGEWKTDPRSTSTPKFKHFQRNPLPHACHVWSTSINTFVSYPAHRMTNKPQWPLNSPHPLPLFPSLPFPFTFPLPPLSPVADPFCGVSCILHAVETSRISVVRDITDRFGGWHSLINCHFIRQEAIINYFYYNFAVAFARRPYL